MELGADDHRRLKAFAEERGLLFFSSPFSVEAVELLEQVGVPAYKIASGEVTNPPLLEAVAATGRPVLLSSGMASLEDVERALGDRCAAAAPRSLVLQCTSTYPCPPEQVNLRAMATMAERFGAPVGLSDHTPDVYTSIAAVALGAVAVEKHFTLSRAAVRARPPRVARARGPARGSSTASARWRPRSGSAEKERDPAHDPVRATFEKSVVDRRRHPGGTVIAARMLTTKRPGNGISALRLGEVVGRRAARDLDANHLSETADLV